MNRSTFLIASLAAAGALWIAPVVAAAPPTSPRDVAKAAKAADLGRQARAAGEIGDFEKAAELFQQQLDLAPDDRWGWYNLARTLAALGKVDEGLDALRQATEHGYDDYHNLEDDALMKPITTSREGRTLLQDWSALLDQQLERNLEESRDIIGGQGAERRIDRLRIVVLTSREERTLDDAQDQLELVAQWAQKDFFPELTDPIAAATDPWVVIVLPEKKEFETWAKQYLTAQSALTKNPRGGVVAGGSASIGGAYDRETRRLVARDLGPSLRHEFAHVLHWRLCDRAKQIHPIWVQEGLCALPEDYDPAAEGGMVPAASWRSNTAKRMLSAGALTSIEDLIRTPRETFMGARPLGWYAQSRTLFLYIQMEGKLPAWSLAYRDAMRDVDAEDPGAQARAADKAFEAAFGKPTKGIDKDYRKWLRDLPEVPEDVPQGAASLGVEVQNGLGEGPAVVSLRLKDSPFKTGDIIYSLDDRRIADIPELVRILASYRPGDDVRVVVRRGDNERELNVELTPR
jgi:tetratricopeptide (TPR) repeat protein